MLFFKKITITISSLMLLSIILIGTACTKEESSKKNTEISKKETEIRFVSVGWTGVTVKTQLALTILRNLGYKASDKTVSVPIVFQGIDSGAADVFLGNWMPAMENVARKFFDKGNIIQHVINMPGAKYTLAAPSYVVDGGLKDFKDIAKFADKLDNKIYGIEAGSAGNKIIDNMIKKNSFGLGKFKLVSSSETAMLLQVKSYVKDKKWIVFFGWAPHHMNVNFDMKYLTGSDASTFGGNNGTAKVYTIIRKGFAKEKPNVARFLENLKFPVSMINEIMTMLNKNKKMKPLEAGLKWLKKHPETYKTWLKGIKTIDGKDALANFEKFLAAN